MSIGLKVAAPRRASDAVDADCIAADSQSGLGTTVPDTERSQVSSTVDTAHIVWPFSDATCDSIHVILALS